MLIRADNINYDRGSLSGYNSYIIDVLLIESLRSSVIVERLAMLSYLLITMRVKYMGWMVLLLKTITRTTAVMSDVLFFMVLTTMQDTESFCRAQIRWQCVQRPLELEEPAAMYCLIHYRIIKHGSQVMLKVMCICMNYHLEPSYLYQVARLTIGSD